MSDEPMAKRRRVDEEVSQNSTQDFNNGNPLFSPKDVQAVGHGFENMDPFLSPVTASSWPFDEFAHDPDYLASQEALRSLMFDTARSVAPTRANTPIEGEEQNSTIRVKHILASGRRVQYLKNYLSNVAPWVSYD